MKKLQADFCKEIPEANWSSEAAREYFLVALSEMGGFKHLFNYIFVYGCLVVCMSVHRVHAVPTKVRRGFKSSWDWSYRQL